ncbi:MAG: hypothetical protein AAF805_12220 [Planctomycetota bacterium]
MKRLIAAIAAAALVTGPAAPDADAQQGAFNGTQRKLPARAYSGVGNRSVRSVPTFSLPVYGGRYGAPAYGYGGARFGAYGPYGYGPVYGFRQPGYVIYPPAVYYGW